MYLFGMTSLQKLGIVSEIQFLIIGFKSSTKLWNHMYKSHIKTKEDFFCSLCNNKAFKKAFNFQLHMLIHLEEQPEKCRFCSKAFRTKPSLRKHELIHTGLKLFSCPQCNSRFKTKDELKQHKISHTTGMKNISLIKRVMPCPFTGPKIFCAGPNVLCQPNNLTAFSASSKFFVPA